MTQGDGESLRRRATKRGGHASEGHRVDEHFKIPETLRRQDASPQSKSRWQSQRRSRLGNMGQTPPQEERPQCGTYYMLLIPCIGKQRKQC